MAKGVLYIMTSSIDGVIKIGKTRKDQYEERMRKLEIDGYRTLAMYRYFASYVSDFDEKEILIHKIFDKSQLGSSELFALDKELVKELIINFEGEQIYPKLNKQPSATNQPISKKENLTFALIDIPQGSELTWYKDDTIKVITQDDKNKVKYKNEIYSISTLAAKLLNLKTAQGGMYFKYNGKLLTDIRKEKGV